MLSRLMKDRQDIFGSLPDTIDDEWIEKVDHLKEIVDQYMHLGEQARDALEFRYERQVDLDYSASIKMRFRVDLNKTGAGA